MLLSELQKLVDKSLNEAGDGEVYLITGINTENPNIQDVTDIITTFEYDFGTTFLINGEE